MRSSGSNLIPRLFTESLNSDYNSRTVDLSPGETHPWEVFKGEVKRGRQRAQTRVIKGVKKYVQLRITST